MNPKAVLFKSQERYSAFQQKLAEYGVDVKVLDFETHEWILFCQLRRFSQLLQ
jgi:hypothetical protein